MKSPQTRPGRRMIPTLAYGFAMVSCLLGLSLCLIKSPQALSDSYLALSAQSANIDAAAAAAWEAARLNPSSPKAWSLLASLLQQKGDMASAQKARFIASHLDPYAPESDPVYALPAELKLSLLAEIEQDIR